MRIILKPGGLALIAVAFLLLIIAAVARWNAPAANNTQAKSRMNAPLRKNQKTQVSGAPIIVPTDQGWSLLTQPPADATKSLFVANDVPGTGDKHALHLEVKAVDSGKYWSAQLLKTVPGSVRAGRSMVVRFWGRSKASTPVYIVFEEGDSPHAAELSKQIALTPQWKEYELPFRTSKDHTEVRANFCIKAGIQPGEADISDVRLNDLGPSK